MSGETGLKYINCFILKEFGIGPREASYGPITFNQMGT